MAGDDLKKLSAKEALKFIEDNTIVGLGGGSTIGYLIDYLSEKVKKGFNIKAVTPSFNTKMYCIKNGLQVLETSLVDRIDIAFDGCDQVDKNMRALKSGGGIHTKEKLIGSMAKEYILLVDHTKFVETLEFKHPVVIELIKDSLSYVDKMVRELGGYPTLRNNPVKDGVIISDYGNLLMDVKFERVEDIEELERKLMKISGVIDTSLFINVVTKVIVAKEDGIDVFSVK